MNTCVQFQIAVARSSLVIGSSLIQMSAIRPHMILDSEDQM